VLCSADHSPPSRAEIKNVWSYNFTPPIRLHGVVLSLKNSTWTTLNLLGGDEWSASHTGRFTPGRTAPGTRRIGQEAVAERSNLCRAPAEDRTPGSLVTILSNISRLHCLM